MNKKAFGDLQDSLDSFGVALLTGQRKNGGTPFSKQIARQLEKVFPLFSLRTLKRTREQWGKKS